jgi:hypothetical protein
MFGSMAASGIKRTNENPDVLHQEHRFTQIPLISGIFQILSKSLLCAIWNKTRV